MAMTNMWSDASVRGSHALNARRARRTKLRCPKDKVKVPEGQKAGPKGRQLEVGAQRAPRLLVLYISKILISARPGVSLQILIKNFGIKLKFTFFLNLNYSRVRRSAYDAHLLFYADPRDNFWKRNG